LKKIHELQPFIDVTQLPIYTTPAPKGNSSNPVPVSKVISHTVHKPELQAAKQLNYYEDGGKGVPYDDST